MSINTTMQSFEFSVIKKLDDFKGVYALYNSLDTLIYYGRSDDSIKSRLLRHLDGDEGRCTQQASKFNLKYTENPSRDEKRLLEEYQQIYGRLPKCNDRIG